MSDDGRVSSDEWVHFIKQMQNTHNELERRINNAVNGVSLSLEEEDTSSRSSSRNPRKSNKTKKGDRK
jgi:predicted outer membrane protein